MAVWQEKFIRPNKYSRPQKKLQAVRKIVMHYTANLGGSANGHFNYFNDLSGRYASAHFFVDKKEALQILPLNEISYHANDGTLRKIPELRPNANFLSVGIELCMEKDGSFHPETIRRAEDVASALCVKYKLDPIKDIVRHYDITGKNCPAPWVKNSAPFTQFKNNVKAKLNGKTTASVKPVDTTEQDNPLLRVGARGVAVERLQTLLNRKGNYKLATDGIFGNGTETAVKDFQAKSGLSVDGIVGTNTWAALQSEAKPEEPKKEPVKAVLDTIKDVKEGDENMKLQLGDAERNRLALILKEARILGLLSDKKWEEKALAGELTVSEAIYLAITLDQRRGGK